MECHRFSSFLIVVVAAVFSVDASGKSNSPGTIAISLWMSIAIAAIYRILNGAWMVASDPTVANYCIILLLVTSVVNKRSCTVSLRHG